MSTEHPGENRRYPRAAVRHKVTYLRLDEFIHAYTRNLSQGGMFVEAGIPYDLGTVLELELSVPTLKDPLVIRARVIWLITDEDAARNPDEIETGMGVEFVHASDEDRRRVESTVEGLIKLHLGRRAYEQLVGGG